MGSVRKWGGELMSYSKFLCGVSALVLGSVSGAPAVYAQTTPVKVADAASEADTSDAPKDIVVTGSRLPSGFNTPTAVQVIGDEQLQARGSATVVEALSDQPTFRNNTSPTYAAGSFAVGQGILDLRGLGVIRTLVLVDGRRHVPNNTNGTFDTNVLPTALIERVDVVTGGASAAYGSDAVAGVVNFVLNDHLQGVKGSIQGGISQEGDSEQYIGNFAAGTSFADGRGHFTVGFDVSKGEKSGTMYSRDWGQSESQFISVPGTRAAGQPAQILADDVHLSIPLGSRVTSCVVGGVTRAAAACPIGNLTFDNGGVVRPFVFGSLVSGTNMIGGENDGLSFHHNQPIRAGTERETGLAHLTFDINDNLKVFAEVSAGRFKVDSETLYYINAGSIIIQRSNPFIPAALAAQMDANGVTQFNLARTNYGQTGGLRPQNVNSFLQGMFGFSGNVSDWKWEAHYTKGQSKFHYRPVGLTSLPNFFSALNVVRDASGNPVCGPAATNPMLLALPAAQRAAFTALISPGCVPFNPFGPGAESRAAISYVAPEDIDSLTLYDQETAAASISGSPFDTWAGPFTIAAGAEWRREQVSTVLNGNYAALSAVSGFFAANPQPGFGKQTVKEGFAEVGIPVVQDSFVKAFDLNAAIRYTDYSASGGVTTWKLGGVLDVVDGLRFRVTRSRDIRAANLPELFYRGNDGFISIRNPVTGLSNTGNNAALNNPLLKPEKADTWTLGMVLQPVAVPGFQASIDLFQIEINGVIGTIPAATIINDYFSGVHREYAQYITFDTAQPSGIARVDVPQFNLNKTKTRGADINMSYVLPWDIAGGKIRLSSSASYLEQLETFGPDGRTLGDIAGAIPHWRIASSINFKSDSFTANLAANFNSKVTYNSFLLKGPEDAGYDPSATNSISQNRFPSAVYFNLNLEKTVINNGGQKMSLYATVDNLFDKDPPRGAFISLNGLASQSQATFSPYDYIGRYFKLGARFQF